MNTSFDNISSDAVARVITDELNNSTRSLTFSVQPGNGFAFPNYTMYVVAWRSNLYANPTNDPLVRIGV